MTPGPTQERPQTFSNTKTELNKVSDEVSAIFKKSSMVFFTQTWHLLVFDTISALGRQKSKYFPGHDIVPLGQNRNFQIRQWKKIFFSKKKKNFFQKKNMTKFFFGILLLRALSRILGQNQEILVGSLLLVGMAPTCEFRTHFCPNIAFFLTWVTCFSISSWDIDVKTIRLA